MYLRRNLFAMLFAVLAAVPVVGQEADLSWKFTKDKKFYQTMTSETKQTMKVMGTDVAQTQEQTFYFEWTPVTELKDGAVTMKQKIIGLKMNIDIGGSKIAYDSKDQAAAATSPLNKFFDALKNGEFTLTVDLKGRQIKEIKGAKEFVDELTKANPAMKQLLEKILSETALKEMSAPMFNALPGKKVTKGKEDATWTHKSELDMGPIGKYTTTYTYTYDGPDKDKKLEKILVKSDLKYTPPDAAAGQGLPFRIKEAKLDAKDSNGTILFDPVTGQIKSSEMGLTLSGNLVIEIGQQSTTVELSQTQKTKIELTDTDPTAVKKPTMP